jgi:hypothetical protein
VQKALTYATLQKAAKRLWSEALARNVQEDRGNTDGEFCPTIYGTTIL